MTSGSPEWADVRITAGIDGSAASIKALRWAARQAELTGATLEFVTAWDWPTSFGWSVPIRAGLDPEADATRVLKQCADDLHTAYPDVVVESRVEQGHPSQILVAASEGASLLVVGCRGHGAFAGMLLGSVSEYCTTHAHCPVLVYRDPSPS